jgi:GxxExxY protein
MTENEIGNVIIGCAIKVHSTVGPGLLESAYEICLAHEMEKQGLSVRQQVLLPLRYDDLLVESSYRLDLLVNERVVIELKAVEAILPVHRAQIISYLKLGGFKLGYLLNFHVDHMRDGIKRFANGL